MRKELGVSQADILFLTAWKCAAGEWDQLGLAADQAREMLFDFIGVIQGDRIQAIRHSRLSLQNSLMALRRGSFEEIQREAPFLDYANRNLLELVGAWTAGGKVEFASLWEKLFAPGWQDKMQHQEPILIAGSGGDSEENALETIGAPDQQTRVATEYWYLNFTFGKLWKALLHASMTSEDHVSRYSVHHVEIFPKMAKRVYFRVRQ